MLPGLAAGKKFLNKNMFQQFFEIKTFVNTFLFLIKKCLIFFMTLKLNYFLWNCQGVPDETTCLRLPAKGGAL